MSKIRCACNHIIVDQTDDLAYKADIVIDKEMDTLFEKVAGATDEDAFIHYYHQIRKTMYQCENCGRILIQKGDSNQFVSFKPESDDWKGILDKPV